jgi:ligand-binding sensor domain-containing protein
MRKIVLILLFMCFFTSIAYSSDVWTLYTNENSGIRNNNILSLAIEEDNSIWVGSINEVSHFNCITWNYIEVNHIFDIVIDDSNNKWFAAGVGIYKYDGLLLSYIGVLPYNWLSDIGVNNSIVIDKFSNVWYGAYSGVAKYEGREWITYGRSDDFFMNDVWDIAVDHDNIIWVARRGGISYYDGIQWKFITSLPDHPMLGFDAVTVDKNNVKWFGSPGAGVFRFDGTNWTVYSSNDGRPEDNVYCLATDDTGILWAGTAAGARSFNGVTWKSYAPDGGYIDSRVFAIAIGKDGTKWFGTANGLYRLGQSTGVSQVAEDNHSSLVIAPNPFNTRTNITISSNGPREVSLCVYSSNGQKIRQLMSDYSFSGSRSINWDGKDNSGHTVSSGIYIAFLKTGNVIRTAKMLFMK